MEKTEKPQDISSWLTPQQTLTIATASMGDAAAIFLMDRLKGGMLVATASRWSKSYAHNAPEISSTPWPIAAELWNNLADEFWNLGDARFFILVTSTTIWCYDVRFDPAVIRQMFPPPSPLEIAAKQPAPAPPAVEELEQKGPRVTDPDLAAWYALYCALFKDAEQSEDHAWASAKGMFQGKSITRARIRTLQGAGTRTRGRKVKERE